MKKIKTILLALVIMVGMVVCLNGATYAEEETGVGGTKISISPVSNMLSISSKSEYDAKFEVKNSSDSKMEVEVYAAPYSYVYSEDEDSYKLGFNNENNYTQIARWITFKADDESWKDKVTYTIDPNATREIDYKITTPNNIPAGGQYAVIFAHTLNGVMSSSGIRTEASPGLIVYGRSTEGDAVVSSEVRDMKIEQSITDGNGTRNNFYATAKVKNTGNIDFGAFGKMTVSPIIGGSSYETPPENARISVIPESELAVSDEWTESPGFGIYKVTWTVTAGEESETIERIVFVNPLPFIIITIILLTIIIGLVIIVVRKRKERRSRLNV